MRLGDVGELDVAEMDEITAKNSVMRIESLNVYKVKKELQVNVPSDECLISRGRHDLRAET